MNKNRSYSIAALVLTGCLSHLQVAVAQSPPSSIDTQSLRLAGARSQGALLTPSSELLPTKSWELSLTYQFEHSVVRALVPTGEVRGRKQSETIHWLNNRQTGYVQIAATPLDRIELVVGAPILISQTAESGLITPSGPTGSSALGDIRMLGRIAVTQPEAKGLAWVLHVGTVVPSGNEEMLFGERLARFEVGTSLGALLPKGFRIDGYLGHTNGRMGAIGNQIFGDTVAVQVAAGQTIGRARWFAELSNLNVISDRMPGTFPKRSSLEVAAGARYQFDAFFLDGGIGFGVLDAGVTPRMRAMVSVGTTGFFGRPKTAETNDASHTGGCVELCDATIQTLQSLVAANSGGPATCVLPPADYSGPLTDAGCIDFSTQGSSEEARQHSLEEITVYFEVGKSELTPTAENTLRGAAMLLMRTEGDVVITGHADDRGSDELNQELSLDRADAARRALIEAGIASERLRIDARGPKEPISPHTDFGRSMNRRVTFLWD